MTLLMYSSGESFSSAAPLLMNAVGMGIQTHCNDSCLAERTFSSHKSLSKGIYLVAEGCTCDAWLHTQNRVHTLKSCHNITNPITLIFIYSKIYSMQ